MSVKRFPSKIDTWLAAVLVIALAAQFMVLILAIAADAGPAATVTVLGATVVVYPLILSIFLRTYYEVDKMTLRIVSGPFGWRIPRDSITGVEASRSLLSSPALSSDRLRIRYGKRRSILVSPADKNGFLRALGLPETEKHRQSAASSRDVRVPTRHRR